MNLVIQKYGGSSLATPAHIRRAAGRIQELKQDSEGREQDTLIRGIYVLRKFCIDRRTNVFLVSEQMMQQEDQIRSLIYEGRGG